MTYAVQSAGLKILSMRFAVRIASAVTGIFIARALGPAGKGTYVYVALVLTFFIQFVCGDSSAIAWQWGRKRLPLNEVFTASLWVGGTVTVVAAIVVSGMAFFQSNALWAVVAVLPFAALAQLSAGVFLTEQRIRPINIQAGIVGIAMPIAASVAAYAFPERLVAVLVVWMSAQIVQGAYSLAALLKEAPHILPLATNVKIAVDHARFAFQVCGQQFLWLLNTRIDVIIVLFTLGTASLGIYSVAIAGNEILWMFTRALSGAAFGRITTNDSARAATLTARCVRHGLLWACLGGIAAFFAGDLIPLVYGQAFAPAVNALRIVLPGAVLWSCLDILSVFFSTHFGKPIIVVSIQAVSASICALVSLLLVSKMAIAGAALGSSLGYFVGASIAIILFIRITGLPLKDVILPRREDLMAYPSFIVKELRARLASSA